jgi:hypothetical protein
MVIKAMKRLGVNMTYFPKIPRIGIKIPRFEYGINKFA